MEDPEPEAVLLPVVDALPDVVPGLLLRQRLAVRRERLHHLEVGVEAMDVVEARWRDCRAESRAVVMVSMAAVMDSAILPPQGQPW